MKEEEKSLLRDFIAYLKEHQKIICYYDGYRRNRHDSTRKGHYPIAEETHERVIDSFLAERDKHRTDG